MNPTSPDPEDEEHRAMREALQRDAARIGEESFDAALHYATMRRIREPGGARRELRGWPMMAFGGACAALLVLGVIFIPWRLAPPEVVAINSAVPSASEPARGTAWAYQRAARLGDEDLLAMLDRDARDLLPPTASLFSVPLH